jgi:hypothetical protein
MRTACLSTGGGDSVSLHLCWRLNPSTSRAVFLYIAGSTAAPPDSDFAGELPLLNG